MMKTRNRALKIGFGVFLAALFAALVLPFFMGAPAAHPATDDFTFAAYTHATWEKTHSLPHVLKDAISYALRTWRDWQGTITGVILMTLNPAVFSLPHYGAHAIVLLALHLAAWFIFCGHVFGRRLSLPRGLWLTLCAALTACSLVFLPDIVEGIYWFNGAWFYTGAQAAALITLVLCDRFAEICAGRTKKAFFAALCCALLFALGMDNYITAMMTAAALFMMALARVWAAHKTPMRGMIVSFTWDEAGEMTEEARDFGGEEAKRKQMRAAIRTALLLLPIGIGLLISVLAPGNSVRMETDGAHQSGMAWMVDSIILTLEAALCYFGRFMVKTPLLALMIALTPALCRALDGMEEKSRRCPPVLLTLFGAYLILCAMIIPHMYSSGYAGSGRVINMYHLYVLLAVPVSYVMILLRQKSARRAALALEGKTCAALSIMALMTCLWLGQQGNYVKLVSDQISGVQDAYIAQVQHEYALCQAAGEQDDVILPPWQVQTMTGKPTAYEDPTVWTNESMAHYFGVRSVRVGETTEE